VIVFFVLLSTEIKKNSSDKFRKQLLSNIRGRTLKKFYEKHQSKCIFLLDCNEKIENVPLSVFITLACSTAMSKVDEGYVLQSLTSNQSEFSTKFFSISTQLQDF
jgi:hypothetical protein